VAPRFDLAIRGGRVVDPESGLDGVRHVGINGDTIVALSMEPLDALRLIDAEGLVVTPGFIDLHSHAQTLAGRRLQACDGVTTALDLEAGRSPVTRAYDRELDGSPINYGFSASWAAARNRALGGREADGSVGDALRLLGETSWRKALSHAQRAEMLDTLSADLAGGAIGIGLLLGYAPEVPTDEYLAVAELAAGARVPTFTHSRELAGSPERGRPDGAEEIVRAAGETGAHMHYCHLNSTAGRHGERVLRLLERCRQEGSTVTAEAYPYGYASTAIGAAFLSPERLSARGLTTEALTYLPTRERVADERRLRQLRQEDPTGLVLLDFFDEADPAERSLLLGFLEHEEVIVASDAMPLVPVVAGFSEENWPIESGAVTHPRSAGCYSKALRLAREQGWPLVDMLRRFTYLPATVLGAACPAMGRKGRVRVGCDADLVVFDPALVSDRASPGDSCRTSSGIRHVLVAGTEVVCDGELDLLARPGRLVTGRR
jgi:hypothetical protein